MPIVKKCYLALDGCPRQSFGRNGKTLKNQGAGLGHAGLPPVSAPGRTGKTGIFPSEQHLILFNKDSLKIAVQTIDSRHAFYTMTEGKLLPELNGAIMKNARQNASVMQAKTHFNYNKLQAAACMVSSAAVSIGLLYLAIRWLA